ncbi:PDR/VanB family oxidoreductase [Novosphingobium sp.]|uniref:PDR/VanB family oxidoreductase n=1 Tax=Novosphingobium sp. TaxID=1874826 RepID=UPI003D10EE75
MRVIADRLPNLRFGKAYEDRQYLPVREVRALVDTPFAWDVTDEGRAKAGRHPKPSEIGNDDGWMRGHVIARRKVATDVVEIVLAADAGALPAWTPGAHAEIELPNSMIRQYSLTGEQTDNGQWTVAVLREADGRGGSRFMHDDLPVGSKIRVRPPRNHFPLSGEGPVLLIAGGIGITPMIPMLAAAEARGRHAELVYLGKSRDGMAYASEAQARGQDRVTVWPAQENGRFDLAARLSTVSSDTTVYCCGPERLIQAVEQACEKFGLTCRAERFVPAQFDDSTNEPFEIELRSTGEVLPVGAGETILSVLGRRGIFVQSTCQQGTCGTCEVGVVEGDILHRDSVLTKEERAADDTIMVCVSRCAGKRLVLKL